MARLSRKTEKWSDIDTPTVLNRPKNLLLSTRKRQTSDEVSDIVCPKCSSNNVIGVIIDEDEKQPIIHFVCEQCAMEWVE
jgi:formate dehydrogenase maturation protein FdhE